MTLAYLPVAPVQNNILKKIWWKRSITEVSSLIGNLNGGGNDFFLNFICLSKDKHKVFGYLGGFFLLHSTLL